MGLTDDLRAIVAPLAGVFGIFARNLGTGEVAEVNADQVLPTQSGAKTFILLHYARLVASGDCDPSRRVEVPGNFVLNGTGVLRYLSDGLSLCLEDLAWLMTTVSDNVATALLILEIGGPEAVNETSAALGLTTARLATFDEMMAGAPFGTSSARDLAEAYGHLDRCCREKLARQQDLNGLPRRLDWSPYAVDRGDETPVRVFNKTGRGPTDFVDSGLFETESARWVAAAMASELPAPATGPDDPAPVAFGEIGLVLHRTWGAPVADTR